MRSISTILTWVDFWRQFFYSNVSNASFFLHSNNLLGLADFLYLYRFETMRSRESTTWNVNNEQKNDRMEKKILFISYLSHDLCMEASERTRLNNAFIVFAKCFDKPIKNWQKDNDGSPSRTNFTYWIVHAAIWLPHHAQIFNLQIYTSVLSEREKTRSEDMQSKQNWLLSDLQRSANTTKNYMKHLVVHTELENRPKFNGTVNFCRKNINKGSKRNIWKKLRKIKKIGKILENKRKSNIIKAKNSKKSTRNEKIF